MQKFMSGGKILDQIEIQLLDRQHEKKITVWIDVYESALATKWLQQLDHLLENQYHLEKNYCFLGFADAERDGRLILDQVNRSIDAINQSHLGYEINDHFTLENTLVPGPCVSNHYILPGRKLIPERTNQLHRYFEDLQGVSQRISQYAQRADAHIRWHIRQLNLLCHEFECWALSYRKKITAPEWQRPSQLMCWLHAPRFELTPEDFELFGIDTLNRPLGGVFVGVNKAVGKHHWEVFQDEGRDSRLSELTTTTLRSQTEAAGDFDIEWAVDPGKYQWQQDQISAFRQWLVNNGFDPDDKSLTIGHPQVGQVDLDRSFGSQDFSVIWQILQDHLDVYQVSTSRCKAVYPYHWSDLDYMQQQLSAQG